MGTEVKAGICPICIQTKNCDPRSEKVKGTVTQSCPTDPATHGSSLPGSSVHGTL